jgi:hypothetical protein
MEQFWIQIAHFAILIWMAFVGIRTGGSRKFLFYIIVNVAFVAPSFGSCLVSIVVLWILSDLNEKRSNVNLPVKGS